MREVLRGLSISAVILCTTAPAFAVTFDFAFVGNPGNACDPATPPNPGCFGDVAYYYQIAKYDVTNSQYAEFLNAVAALDTNNLYDPNMGNPGAVTLGGITRSGSQGSYTYIPVTGREDKPVNWVTFYNAARFANWLHNGQPSGLQGPGTTETGAYTITAVGIENNTITRNSGAQVWIPSENEWFKSAYHNPTTTGQYDDYPFGNSTPPNCTTPTAAPNSANCNNAVADLTDVGSYPGSSSFYGTFDQGGNVNQWNDTVTNIFGPTSRGIRGGSYEAGPGFLFKGARGEYPPVSTFRGLGFRVAPEPGGDLLLLAGAIGVGCLRRRRAWASRSFHQANKRNKSRRPGENRSAVGI